MDGWMDRIGSMVVLVLAESTNVVMLLLYTSDYVRESKDLSGKFDIRVLSRAPRTKRGPCTSSFTLTKE